MATASTLCSFPCEPGVALPLRAPAPLALLPFLSIFPHPAPVHSSPSAADHLPRFLGIIHFRYHFTWAHLSLVHFLPFLPLPSSYRFTSSIGSISIRYTLMTYHCERRITPSYSHPSQLGQRVHLANSHGLSRIDPLVLFPLRSPPSPPYIPPLLLPLT